MLIGKWCFCILFLILDAEAIPKDYFKKPGISTFHYASDLRSINYRKYQKCGIDIVLNWKTELQSSCYATPVAFPYLQSQTEDILVSQFWKYTNIVDARGELAEDVQYNYGDKRFYSSPFVFDVNKDGLEEVITVDENGYIRITQKSSQQRFQSVNITRLPTLHVNRYWFEQEQEIIDKEKLQSVSSFESDNPEPMVLLEFLNKAQKTYFSSYQGPNEEEYKIQQMKRYQKEGISHTILDPHVLADIGSYVDNTHLILYIPVSYYLSASFYTEGIKGIVLEKYLACGVAAYNVSSNSMLWSQIYGMSTMSAINKAYIYSTPVTVDLEGMGYLTTIFGTSQGWLFAVDEKGNVKRNFPIHFNEIQMTPVCADLVGDAYLEIIVGDVKGNLAVLASNGEEIWSTIVSGSIAHSVSIADVDGDGVLDLVVATKNGDIWAVRGDNGKSIPYFPIRTGKSIQANPLIVDLSSTGQGIHIVAAIGNGEILIVDGRNGCSRLIDLSEEVYSRILAVKSANRELISLVVATMNGNLIELTTSGKWNVLNSYANLDINMQSIYSPHYMAIYYGSGTEQYWDVLGNHVELPVTIVDKRLNAWSALYSVSVIRKGEVIYKEEFDKAGTYVLRFDLQETGFFNLMVLLENEHKQEIRLNVSIHANVENLNYIKWIILVPFVLLSSLLIFSTNLGNPLPL